MPDAKNHDEAAPRARDDQEFSRDAETRLLEGHADSPSLAADQARATQALRDVRHLLPPEGVAIVDEALAGVRFGDDEAPLFDSGVEPAWTRAFIN